MDAADSGGDLVSAAASTSMKVANILFTKPDDYRQVHPDSTASTSEDNAAVANDNPV